MDAAKNIGELHDSGEGGRPIGVLGRLPLPLIAVVLVAIVDLLTAVYAITRYLETQNWIWIAWAVLNLAVGVGLLMRQRLARTAAIVLFSLNSAVTLFLLKSGPGWLFLLIVFWMVCIIALLDALDAFKPKRE
ncbi:MAG TPA: hypothetical protein VJ183_00105 [Chloroflexia bacterium]|nr:hypothetical protein [Chloroflexia bacterium]